MMVTELGNFLHTRRSKIDRSTLDLPDYYHKPQSHGVKREEIALLVGISADYYARIEQGKITRPSLRVLSALANILCQDELERKHLYRLAEFGYTPQTEYADTDDICPPHMLELIHKLDAPAYVINNKNDILEANPATYILFFGLDQWPAEKRNTIRYLFLHPSARSLYPEWNRMAENCTAHLYNQLGLYPQDEKLAAFIQELRRHSEDFRRIWKNRDVYALTHGAKTFLHPLVGTFTLNYEVLLMEGTKQRLVTYYAEPNTSNHEALQLLMSVDPQGYRISTDQYRFDR